MKSPARSRFTSASTSASTGPRAPHGNAVDVVQRRDLHFRVGDLDEARGRSLSCGARTDQRPEAHARDPALAPDEPCPHRPRRRAARGRERRRASSVSHAGPHRDRPRARGARDTRAALPSSVASCDVAGSTGSSAPSNARTQGSLDSGALSGRLRKRPVRRVLAGQGPAFIAGRSR